MAVPPLEAIAENGSSHGREACVLRILLVEDERKVSEAIQEGLRGESYAVEAAYSGEEGFFRISSGHFDLVILDVMLPQTNGFEVLSLLRRQGVRTPVLRLTAKDAIEDRVRGLDLGADDYLVKPFAFSELSARVRALLRRGSTLPRPILKMLDLEMDLIRRRVTRGGQLIELTAKEFELLEYLLLREGEVVSRAMIAHDV